MRNKIIFIFIKAALLIFCFFVFMGWLINGFINLRDSILFTVLITFGTLIPIIFTLKIVTPELNKDTPEERLNSFKENNIAMKLMGALTLCMSLFLLLMWFTVPLSFLTFWKALAFSVGIGFLFAVVCTLACRFIIMLENSPFQQAHR